MFTLVAASPIVAQAAKPTPVVATFSILGDMVERREILGYRGILLEQMFMMPEHADTQLNLYDDEDWSFWKVLWFKHPYENPPIVDGHLSRDLMKIRKGKHNGLQSPKI